MVMDCIAKFIRSFSQQMSMEVFFVRYQEEVGGLSNG